LAPEAALGLLLSIALSSAQAVLIIDCSNYYAIGFLRPEEVQLTVMDCNNDELEPPDEPRARAKE
jgi:predicted choloylglycine hydrolase